MSAPSPREAVTAYLRMAGLESLLGREADVERAVRDLVDAMGEKVAINDESSLYSYTVPMLTEDGSCSIVDQLAPVPYDLSAILGGRSEQTTRRLALLERLVERAQETTAADWVGIYQRRTNPEGLQVLVKVSYVGRPSRAEFPLTRAFAQRSTNSTVGLTGRSTCFDTSSITVERPVRPTVLLVLRCANSRVSGNSARLGRPTYETFTSTGSPAALVRRW